jgi:hypothetical protein
VKTSLAHSGPNHRIQSGAIAAAGQHTNSHPVSLLKYSKPT